MGLDAPRPGKLPASPSLLLAGLIFHAQPQLCRAGLRCRAVGAGSGSSQERNSAFGRGCTRQQLTSPSRSGRAGSLAAPLLTSQAELCREMPQNSGLPSPPAPPARTQRLRREGRGFLGRTEGRTGAAAAGLSSPLSPEAPRSWETSLEEITKPWQGPSRRKPRAGAAPFSLLPEPPSLACSHRPPQHPPSSAKPRGRSTAPPEHPSPPRGACGVSPILAQPSRGGHPSPRLAVGVGTPGASPALGSHRCPPGMQGAVRGSSDPPLPHPGQSWRLLVVGEARTHRPQLLLCCPQPLWGHPPQHPKPPQPQTRHQPPKLAIKTETTPATTTTGTKPSGEALPQPTPAPNWLHPIRALPPPQIQQPGREVPPRRSRTHPALPTTSPLLTSEFVDSGQSTRTGQQAGSERASEGELLAAPPRQPDFPFPLRETQPLPQRGRWGSAELLGGRPAPASTEASPPHVDVAGGHAAAPGCSWRCRSWRSHLVPEPTRGEKRVAVAHGEVWGSAGPRRAGCRFLHPAGCSGTEAAAPCAYAPPAPLYFFSCFRASWFQSCSPGDS